MRLAHILRRCWRLSAAERRLLLTAALLLAATRASLRWLPLPTVRRGLRRMLQSTRQRVAGDPVEQIVRAVTLASHTLPGTDTCLLRALVATALLERAGYPAEMRLGLCRTAQGQLIGHAWVECQQQIVIGGDTDEPYVYTPLREGDQP